MLSGPSWWSGGQAGDDTETDDEFLVLRSLQWRDDLSAAPGSPYVRPDYNPSISDNAKDYRIRWNGRVFTLLEPGDSGKGLKIVYNGDDYTSNYSFPDDYQPAS